MFIYKIAGCYSIKGAKLICSFKGWKSRMEETEEDIVEKVDVEAIKRFVFGLKPDVCAEWFVRVLAIPENRNFILLKAKEFDIKYPLMVRAVSVWDR